MKRLVLVAMLLWAPAAAAFPHVVKQGESLAMIAQRVYGDARLEGMLVGANGLDAQGGSAIRPGMRLEIPAPGHHRCTGDETWFDLAATWLGDKRRAEVLAKYNDEVNVFAKIAPGQEIAIPHVLAHVAADGDILSALAKRYLRDANRAWEIDLYNDLKGGSLHRGDLVLVPLLDLPLTPEGRVEAKAGAELARSAAGGAHREAQRKAEHEIPQLYGDVHGGRYVDAVARGNRLLGTGDLTGPQVAHVHRALLEAYVALDAQGAAAGACAAWKANDPQASLDPARVSPKIRAACASR